MYRQGSRYIPAMPVIAWLQACHEARAQLNMAGDGARIWLPKLEPPPDQLPYSQVW